MANLYLENTRFIFTTNFSGDPSRDKYGNSARCANVVINDIEVAKQLIDDGFNVKMTKPREGDDSEFIPTYYIRARVNYDSEYPPKIYLMQPDGHGTLLNGESVGTLDFIWVQSVNVMLNLYENKMRGTKTAYVRSMEVFQRVDDDPIAARHREMENRADVVELGGEDEPF